MTELVSRTFLINGQTITIDLPPAMDFLVGKIGSNGETFVSDSMQRVVSKIRSYAAGDDPIVIDGELGTGKGFVARVLHCNDPIRKDRPLIGIDCQTIQLDSLEQWESKFFGSVRLNKTGYLQEVQQGTLYIKNIASMPLAFQSKLLQAFKEKRGQKVGSTTFDDYGNFRVIVGSKRKLEKIKQEEKLDESLYYHLDGLNISLPSLRNRQDGIIDLADYFLGKINRKRQSENKAPLVFDDFFEESLKRFAFFLKGNITELEKLINDCAKNCIDTLIITNQHVPDRFPTFGMGMENALVQYFQDHLFKIDYRDKSAGYIAMSIASTFYTNNDRFVNIVSSDKNIHLFSDTIKNNVGKISSLSDINSLINEELEARKRELILKYLDDGKALDEIAQELGYSSGAGLTTTIQDMIYEQYDKICQERHNKIDQGVLSEIGNTFKKSSAEYVSKYIVKGLYKKLKKDAKEANGPNGKTADETTIRNAIVSQVSPMEISPSAVDKYLKTD